MSGLMLLMLFVCLSPGREVFPGGQRPPEAGGSIQWRGGGGVGAGGRGVSRHPVLGTCHLSQDYHG